MLRFSGAISYISIVRLDCAIQQKFSTSSGSIDPTLSRFYAFLHVFADFCSTPTGLDLPATASQHIRYVYTFTQRFQAVLKQFFQQHHHVQINWNPSIRVKHLHIRHPLTDSGSIPTPQKNPTTSPPSPPIFEPSFCPQVLSQKFLPFFPKKRIFEEKTTSRIFEANMAL